MRKRKSNMLSEINVTSLVDVTLVLLIIFMISAPFIRGGVKLDLPSAEIREKHPANAISVAVNQYGQVYFDHQNISDEELSRRLSAVFSTASDTPVLLEGDAAANYGRIIEVMDAIRSAGFENVGLVLNTLDKR
ncbi:MAG: biopolymer transporter ExbD [Calditrichia bacterium]|nr:biopolymer transporter ExbD [Calditrichota bacterium]